MQIGDWPGSKNLNEIYRNIRALGLETNLAEIEAFGFTIIENAIPKDTVTKMRDAVLKEAERRYKTRIDMDNSGNFQDWKLLPYMLFKDPAFADAVLHPKGLALVDYFLGPSCILHSLVSHPKGPGGEGRPLHADTGTNVPSPMASYEQGINCYYFLTDDTKEGGALSIVPGSHRESRQPTPAESSMSGATANPNAIAVEGRSGTMAVFIGKVWHGSFPRTIPGLRVNLSAAYVRPYFAPLEDYKNTVTLEFLERHGGRDSRMAQLLALNTWWGWRDEGPNPELVARTKGVNRTWHG
jgi:ectoine hydroxylase-related dioxygenase (phytanoyl-CoA dioxygenase family)